jgi:hypothetical protein
MRSFPCIYREKITNSGYGLVIHMIRINAIFTCTAFYRINRTLIILTLKVMWKKALRKGVGGWIFFNFTSKTLTWNEQKVYYVWQVSACLRKPLLPYKLARILSKFHSALANVFYSSASKQNNYIYIYTAWKILDSLYSLWLLIQRSVNTRFLWSNVERCHF